MLDPVLLAELRKRQGVSRQSVTAGQNGRGIQGVIDSLHPKQRDFVLDASKRKTAICSRRAGKSWGIAAWLLQGGFSDPAGLSVYAARSKGDARMILWPEVMAVMNERFRLGLELHEQDGQLIVLLPNRHRIWLAGVKDKSEIGKFRGKKYRRAVVDEAQELPFLEELISASLQPALIDKSGELCLTGTPSPAPAGLFYERTTGDGKPAWSPHRWTILDNPHIPHALTELAELRKEYGWTEAHPTYRREWLGEWVMDLSALVYQYSAERNARQPPDPVPSNAVWCLGLDIGFVDPCAFVLGYVVPGLPEIQIVSAEARPGLIPSAVAAHVERYRSEHPGMRVVVDEGGAGKGYAEEMRQRYAIPCEPAEKTKKRAYQEIIGGELRNGQIKIDPWTCRPLLDEMSIQQWLPDKSAADERFADHCTDAMLYLCRALRSHYRPVIEPPKPGTPEWWEAQRKAEREAAKKRSAKRTKHWPPRKR